MIDSDTLATHPSTAAANNSLDSLRQPPHSLEAEQSVLGGLLIDSGAFDDVAIAIRSADFFHPPHRIIFEVMTRLAQLGNRLDVVTVSDALKDMGELEHCGGLAYLAELARNTPSAANSREYANIVRERAIQREIIRVSRDIVQSAYSPAGLRSEDIVNQAVDQVSRITQDRPQDSAPRELKVIMQAVIERIDDLHKNKSDYTGIPSGLHRLDDLTSGWQKGDLVILAARASMGKTSLAMNCVEHALLSQDKPILVFSLEMSAESLVTRMLSSLGKIDQKRMRDGNLKEEDWSRLSAAAQKLLGRPLFIDDTAGLTPIEMRNRIKRVSSEPGSLGLIMVDYLQLMRVADFREGRTAEVSEISRSLKAIAREFNVPVIALSQLNRDVEKRPNKRPQNADLRESGALEQDADVILFIYRDDYYNKDSEEKGIAEIIVSKQRNGPTDTVKVAWIDHHTRFDNLPDPAGNR